MSSYPEISELIDCLFKAADGSLRFSNAALNRWIREMSATTSGQELYALLSSMIQFAAFLRYRRGADAAAVVLLEAMPPLVERLEGLARQELADMERAEDARRQLSEARGLTSTADITRTLVPKGPGGFRLR